MRGVIFWLIYQPENNVIFKELDSDKDVQYIPL